MPGAGDIRAGRAYVELLLNDSKFVKGLASAGRRLTSFGTGIAKIGGAVHAAGDLVLGVFGAALKVFSDTGSALNDMSMRTGIAGSKLAELGYAAEQSGSSLTEVEGGIRKMQKTLGAAAQGSKEARTALSNLGISLAEIKNLSPDKQFEAISEKIAAIQDPTKRAAAAMSIFGKSGTQLLPMIQDMASLTAEFRASGLGPTDEDIKKADALGDAFGKMVAFGKGIFFNLGAALAEDAMKGIEAITRIVVTAGKWIKENKQLIVTVAKIGGVIILAGTAITALGLAIATAGMALSGIAAGLGVLGGVLGAILSPLGLITAGLAAGAYAWANYTESGQAAISGIATVMGQMKATVLQAFGGISDAIMAGDLALAGQIAVTGLQVALLQGITALSTSVGGKFGEFIGKMGVLIAGGDFAGAWDVAVAGMSAVWSAFAEGVISVFSNAATAVIDLWQSAMQYITDFILRHASTIEAIINAISPAAGLALQQAGGLTGGIDLAAEQARRDMLDAQLRAKGLGGGASPTVLDEAQKAAKDDIAAAADRSRGQLAELNRAAQKRTQDAFDDARNAVAGGGQEADEALAKLQAKLDALTAEAAAKRQAGQGQFDAIPAVAGGPEATAAMKQDVFGSFSAAALAAQGGGGGPMDRVAKGVEKLVHLDEKHFQKLEKIREAIERGPVAT